MIPMQCEYYALEGLSDLVNTIKKVRSHLNGTLEIEGLLRTMFDARNMLAQQVSAQLEDHFGKKFIKLLFLAIFDWLKHLVMAFQRSFTINHQKARWHIWR